MLKLPEITEEERQQVIDGQEPEFEDLGEFDLTEEQSGPSNTKVGDDFGKMMADRRLRVSAVRESSPADNVTVRTIRDHKHTVGDRTFKYEAMKPTLVPGEVAEILRDAGLLYLGGVEPAETGSIGDWTIEVPR